MEREKCFGMVIVRREGKGLRYLLLHKGGGYWGFPKGRPQPGEDQLTTAKRELAEETGITDVKMIDGFCHGYNYDFDTVIEGGIKKTIYKHDIFYLGEVTNDTIKISDEHVDFGWFDYETALKRIFHQEIADLLKTANKFLLDKRGFVL